jgi:hypothetical protein
VPSEQQKRARGRVEEERIYIGKGKARRLWCVYTSFIRNSLRGPCP